MAEPSYSRAWASPSLLSCLLPVFAEEWLEPLILLGPSASAEQDTEALESVQTVT